MPSISVMSLRRATCGKRGAWSSAKQTGIGAAVARARFKNKANMRRGTRISLKGQQFQHRSDNDVWLARGISHGALPLDFHLQIRNRTGGDGIVGENIARTN